MTDRIKGLYVALEANIRADDCALIISAIAMIRGVVRVDSKVTDEVHYFARSQVLHEIQDDILKVIRKAP